MTTEIKMVPHRKKSKMLSDKLDKMGFSRNRVQERQLIYQRISSIRYEDIGEMENILVGSLREGIGYLFYNDTDILWVHHNIICETNITEEHVEGKTVLQIDEKDASPGYCFLKVVSISDTSINTLYMKDLMMENLPVSNMEFRIRLEAQIPAMNEVKVCPLEGPSVPVQLRYISNYFADNSVWSNLNFKTDIVTAFPCKVDHMLLEWKDRKRHYWPDSKTITKIMTLPTYVVPVGEKDEQNEWRISFVMAEIHLVHSFNDTQTKVYVLMKIIAKHHLKPLCKDISSYVVKNVMFWLCENVPKKKFMSKFFMHRFRDALKILKTAVEKHELPNYIIPERNLFEGKLKCDKQNKKITNLLEKLVKYSGRNFYKENTQLACIQQEVPQLQANKISDYFNLCLLKYMGTFLFTSSLLHLWFNYLADGKGYSDLKTLSQYEKGSVNMLSPYPYWLVFFLTIMVKLLLMKVLPQFEIFISDHKYLTWIFVIGLVLFFLIQLLKMRYRKPAIVDVLHLKRKIIYTPKSVQRLEEIIVFLFIPLFALLLGFTDITVGVNLPFIYLCFSLVLVSYQVRKFGNQFEVMTPGIKRYLKMKVIFLLLFVVTIYVTW